MQTRGMPRAGAEPVPHRGRAPAGGDDRPGGGGARAPLARGRRARVAARRSAAVRKDEPAPPGPRRRLGRGLGDGPRRPRGRALPVERGRADRAGVRPRAQGRDPPHGRRALPRLAGRALARRGRVHGVAPVEPAHRRRERAAAPPRPAGEAARADRRLAAWSPSTSSRTSSASTARTGSCGASLQHQTAVASYAFSGSAPTLMERLFEDPSRPLLEHAVSVELAPLPPGADGRITSTSASAYRSATSATRSTRSSRSRAGHPQRTMLLAHHLWELVPRGSVADEAALGRRARPRARAGRARAPRALGVARRERAAREPGARDARAEPLRGGDGCASSA